MEIIAQPEQKIKDFIYQTLKEAHEKDGSSVSTGMIINGVKKNFTQYIRTLEEDGNSDEDIKWMIISLRNQLRDEGRINVYAGRGGRNIVNNENTRATTDYSHQDDPKNESSYYAEFEKQLDIFLSDYYADHFNVKQITAHKGSRNTGGKWSRPDVSVYIIKKLKYAIPSRFTELITFEIKLSSTFNKEAIHETLSHYRRCNKSYLVVVNENSGERILKSDENFELFQEIREYGLGLILIEDINDYDEWEIMIEPLRRENSSVVIDEFIEQLFSDENKKRIQQLLP